MARRRVAHLRTAIRAQRYAALGDPVRLAIVDELSASDRSPIELQASFDLTSNLLTHHLDVLERAGLITRRRSDSDGRRRYVRLDSAALPEIQPGRPLAADRVLFVCTHNSARSPLAAALWHRVTGGTATSAGTHPAQRVHPGAVAAARRKGLDLTSVVPRNLADVGDETATADLVITVCDRAHEELTDRRGMMHWSIADPVAIATAAAFDEARDELERRIESLGRTILTAQENDGDPRR